MSKVDDEDKKELQVFLGTGIGCLVFLSGCGLVIMLIMTAL